LIFRYSRETILSVKLFSNILENATNIVEEKIEE